MSDGWERDGFAVLRSAAPAGSVAAALRALGLAVRRHGLPLEAIHQGQASTFFPSLRWEPEVWGVLPPCAAELLGWEPGDDWAEPQILLRLPDDEPDWPLVPHVDTLPPWASRQQRYKGVVGVALTDVGPRDGAVALWPGSHRGAAADPVTVPLCAGDALVMHPDLRHAGTLNRGCTIRTAIYFRLVAGGGRPDPA